LNSFTAIILGIVQGLTEFLPISSSGHLVIFQSLFNVKENQLTFSIFLHFGTLLPIIIIFWQDIKDIILFKKEKRRLTYLILIAIIPTAFIGIFFEDFFAGLFSSVINVGFMLIITGLLLFLAEKWTAGSKHVEDLKSWQAILVGVAQGIAILPGISRSGLTIVASLFQKLSREDAARFSFLISIPVIGGAGLLELKDLFGNATVNIDITNVILGVTAAMISGYFAIKYLLHILHEGSLIIFSYYCWFVGIIIILAGII